LDAEAVEDFLSLEVVRRLLRSAGGGCGHGFGLVDQDAVVIGKVLDQDRIQSGRGGRDAARGASGGDGGGRDGQAAQRPEEIRADDGEDCPREEPEEGGAADPGTGSGLCRCGERDAGGEAGVGAGGQEEEEGSRRAMGW
jgi:hypothetical protein